MLAEAEQMLGVANDRQVYAVISYDGAQSDELTFKAGDLLKIIRRGDKREANWWWARSASGKEGYVPKNLFAVSLVK